MRSTASLTSPGMNGARWNASLPGSGAQSASEGRGVLSPGERTAFIGLSASFFFNVEDARLHGIQVLLLATFIGLVIFMIFALDRPFRGDLGLRPDAYQVMFDQLMKGNP